MTHWSTTAPSPPPRETSILGAVTDDDLRRLGIQRDYLDNADRPARLADETVAALQAALGAPEPGIDQRAPVVVRSGEPVAVPGVVGVTLEDGTERELADGLPLGYHWVHTTAGRRRLIVSPGICSLPAARQWGWTTQLYATRSHSSWGIGDLADLARLTELARQQGAGFVLANPLHAGGSTSIETPEQPSPYFPSSRRFFTPLYLSVPEVDGAREALGARLDGLAAVGHALNDDRQIDRDAVWRLKKPALRDIFEQTQAARSPELAAWRQARGQSVEDFAAWCVLAERHGRSWPEWPADARRPDGPAARAVRQTAPHDVAFVAWLQWQLEKQLRAAGRSVQVLQDLPIGVDPGGADAWAYQDALALDVTVGAPPDPFNRAGQDWGLPPFVPWRLREAQYEPFVEAVRATMALAGGLRIDHVMGLFRLWWIPDGMAATDGGYVRYPSDDLLDIVALESVRAAAPVVGEDLGTVEPGVREQLAARNVLSYRLLWFEEEPPAKWPASALAAVGTHDLPTVAGMWDGSDLEDQRASGLDADEEATRRLRELLVERGDVAPDAPVAAAVAAAYRLLAEAPSLLRAASLEDALEEPVRPNIPGTEQRPNWSRALAVPLDDFADHDGVRTVARLLGGEVVGDRR
jgi:4-alpha-glucanotransferase